MLDGLETLFQQYVLSEDTKKLARIRIENVNAFHAFAVLCLRHTVGMMTWKLKHRKFKVSDIFTVSDETLALIVLENNAMLWRNKAYGLDGDNANARYMERAQDGSVRKVWSNEGKRRFNEVFCQLKELRSFSLSRTNETELIRLWNQSSKSRPRDRSGNTDSSGAADMDMDGEVIVIFED